MVPLRPRNLEFCTEISLCVCERCSAVLWCPHSLVFWSCSTATHYDSHRASCFPFMQRSMSSACKAEEAAFLVVVRWMILSLCHSRDAASTHFSLNLLLTLWSHPHSPKQTGTFHECDPVKWSERGLRREAESCTACSLTILLIGHRLLVQHLPILLLLSTITLFSRQPLYVLSLLLILLLVCLKFNLPFDHCCIAPFLLLNNILIILLLFFFFKLLSCVWKLSCFTRISTKCFTRLCTHCDSVVYVAVILNKFNLNKKSDSSLEHFIECLYSPHSYTSLLFFLSRLPHLWQTTHSYLSTSSVLPLSFSHISVLL